MYKISHKTLVILKNYQISCLLLCSILSTASASLKNWSVHLIAINQNWLEHHIIIYLNFLDIYLYYWRPMTQHTGVNWGEGLFASCSIPDGGRNLMGIITNALYLPRVQSSLAFIDLLDNTLLFSVNNCMWFRHGRWFKL